MLSQNWQALYNEMRAFREACGDAHVKAILATGELGTLRNVARASRICMMAGADFIKTSTGKESVNATLPVSLTMIRQIRDYYDRTGYHVGYKPAGGISKAKDALTYLTLIKEELEAVGFNLIFSDSVHPAYLEISNDNLNILYQDTTQPTTGMPWDKL